MCASFWIFPHPLATGVSVMGAYYGDGAGLPAKTLTVKGLKDGAELYLLDEDRDMEKAPMIVKDGEAALTLQPYTVFLIRA